MQNLRNKKPGKGDIIVVEFPFTDGSGGKLRPALVIGISANTIITLFITSQHRSYDIVLPIEATHQTGLHVSSFIHCDKIASVDVRIVNGAIGVVSKELLRNVDVKLKELLKL